MIGLFKDIVKLIIWCGGWLMPKNRHKIIFGAWGGKSYADTAKYLFQYFFDKPEYKLIWVGDADVRSALPVLPQNAKFVAKGSALACYHAATAGFWAYTHSPEGDISRLPLCGRAVLLNLDHGIGLKRYGTECPSYKLNNGTIRKRFSLKPPKQVAYLVRPNHIQAEACKRSFPQFNQSPVLPFGLPTEDWMKHVRGNRKLAMEYKARFAEMFGLPLNRRWFVYAPTFRWTVEDNFSFANIPNLTKRELLTRMLECQNAIIVEKLHPRVLLGDERISYDNVHVFGIGGEKARLIEPLELFLAADFIISDYSSVAYSGYLMGVPVVHFAYDLDFYVSQDTGLLFPLDEMNVGPIVTDIAALCDVLSDHDAVKWQVGNKVQTLLEWDTGRACEQIKNFMETFNC